MTKLESILTLNMIPQVGSMRIKKLLEHFKSAERVLSANEDTLCRVEGIGKSIAQSIISGRSKVDVNKELDLIKKNNITVLTPCDPQYPQNLKTIYDPPAVLYVKGEIIGDDNISVAIVGARRASFYGLSMAEKLAGEIARLGITVVSGMARGIDSAAHRGALKSGGRTIAVLGSGLGNIYPSENKKLFEEISQNGAVVSEYPMLTKPLAGNFPARNRIISGLSLGVVVVEASRNSGALITADSALEQGREVFAVPGKIDSITSFGANRLIKQGAKLISAADDIIEELKLDIQNKISESKESKEKESMAPSLNLSNEEGAIFNSISSAPRHIDDIINESGLPASKVMATLMQMEMRHLIKQLPGKLFVRLSGKNPNDEARMSNPFDYAQGSS